MSIELEGQHRCIERSTDCDCPICGEYMFTSVMTVVFMVNLSSFQIAIAVSAKLS